MDFAAVVEQVPVSIIVSDREGRFRPVARERHDQVRDGTERFLKEKEMRAKLQGLEQSPKP
jgi:hypothetical protein